MTAPTGSLNQQQTQPPPRLLRRAGITLAVLILGAVTLVAIWLARRYQQGIELAKHAQEQYTALNTRYPFKVPRPGESLPLARWEALLRVRERLLRDSLPSLRPTIDKLLAASSVKDPSALRELADAVPRLQNLLDTQLNALAAEQMSAGEYQWMLGLAIAKVLDSGGSGTSPAGDMDVLLKLERLTRAGGDPRNTLDAQAAMAFLRKNYAGAADPPKQALEAVRGADTGAAALDMLLAAAQWAVPESKGQDLLGRLMPKGGKAK